MFYVYILARPDGRAFYVGKGKDDRIFAHEKQARFGVRSHKCNVIRKIWRSGGEIQRYTVFTTEDEAEALAYEQLMIALLGRENLTNKTDGGEGNGGRSHTAEQNRKQSSAMRRKWSDPGYREKALAAICNPVVAEVRRTALKARWSDPEHRAKMLAIFHHPSYREQCSLRNKAIWNIERRAAMGERARQMWADPELATRMREGISRTIKAGWDANPERKQRTSEFHRELWNDPDYRAHMIAVLNTPDIRNRIRAKQAEHWTPERRKDWAEHVQNRWRNPEYRERMLASFRREEMREASRQRMLRLREDPSFVEKQRESARKTQNWNAMQTPEARAKSAASQQSDESRQKKREAALQRWADPEFRARMLPKLEAARAAQRQQRDD